MSAHADSRDGRSTRASTVAALWRHAVAREHEFPAFLAQEGREWRPVGWGEAGARVEELAAGFHALGVRTGERVAILARTRLEWTLCDYALAALGAVVVPIYQMSSADECAHVLADSGAATLVVEDAELLDKVSSAGAALPALSRTVSIDGAPGAIPLTEVAERGREELAARPDAVGRAAAAVAPDDTLTFIYTSGTTGKPKGCVLTHRNWMAMVESVRAVEGLLERGDTTLLFLPLAHNFARLVQFCGPAVGFTIAHCREPAEVGRALTAVRPTVFPSVPRLYEKVYATARAKVEQTTGARRRVGDWAFGVGGRAAAVRERGGQPSPLLALQLRAADRLAFSRVRERLGGRMRIAVSGGAPLTREIIEFFAACGVLILEGYGLSETTSACTVNRPTAYRFGTVGRPLPGIDVDLADDGEIRVRGETVFQGYHGDDEATARVRTDDGWLLTGDVGAFDEDGFLTITDRKKELIVTSGGKKIAPQAIEGPLKAAPGISQALVVGDRRPYLVALVSVDEEEARAVAGDGAIGRDLVARAVADVNRRLGPHEQIKRFTVLSRDFSADHGEVTPTLKLKRRVCESNFRDEIEALYRRSRSEAAAARPA